MPILCSETDINDLLGGTYWYRHNLDDIIQLKSFDNIKAWFVSLIEKKELSLLV